MIHAVIIKSSFLKVKAIYLHMNGPGRYYVVITSSRVYSLLYATHTEILNYILS